MSDRYAASALPRAMADAANRRAHVRSQVVFYLGWILMVIGESIAWAYLGFFVGWVVFVAGGTGWGYWHIRRTEVDAPLHGGLLPLSDRLLRRSDWRPAAIFPVALLVGGPGVGLVLRKQGAQSAGLWALTASVLYASAWCAIHALRPDAGLAVDAWPKGLGRIQVEWHVPKEWSNFDPPH